MPLTNGNTPVFAILAPIWTNNQGSKDCLQQQLVNYKSRESLNQINPQLGVITTTTEDETVLDTIQ
jgi:hypothetical protein